jgi:hypothetical protein
VQLAGPLLGLFRRAVEVAAGEGEVPAILVDLDFLHPLNLPSPVPIPCERALQDDVEASTGGRSFRVAVQFLYDVEGTSGEAFPI